MSERDNEEDLSGGEGVLERDLRAALGAVGWLPPETPDEVARAEAELAASAPAVPGALADPAAAWSRRETDLPVLRLPGFSDDAPTAAKDLARAARHGGRITPEVEEQMRRDREEAERKLDDEAENEGDK